MSALRIAFPAAPLSVCAPSATRGLQATWTDGGSIWRHLLGAPTLLAVSMGRARYSHRLTRSMGMLLFLPSSPREETLQRASGDVLGSPPFLQHNPRWKIELRMKTPLQCHPVISCHRVSFSVFSSLYSVGKRKGREQKVSTTCAPPSGSSLLSKTHLIHCFYFFSKKQRSERGEVYQLLVLCSFNSYFLPILGCQSLGEWVAVFCKGDRRYLISDF